jgi:hypothetical protein
MKLLIGFCLTLLIFLNGPGLEGKVRFRDFTIAAESGGLRTFYSVQGEADAVRLAAGGAPWPTGLQRANLGEGLYAWGTRAEAEAYAAGKQGASILEFKMPSGDYSGLKTLDMRLMSDEAATNWLGQYSQYGQGLPHGFEHIIRQTGRGADRRGHVANVWVAARWRPAQWQVLQAVQQEVINVLRGAFQANSPADA